jgi:tRNA pseudouridine38-40 synthase
MQIQYKLRLKAFRIFFKQQINLTGSSRTDAGVHAVKNYFHFDFDEPVDTRVCYNLNAILPDDIVIKKISPVYDSAHCRFDALFREYKYYIYKHKDPFLADRAYYFPYKLNETILQDAADLIKQYQDFSAFSKRNTQVKTFRSEIFESGWIQENDCLVYNIKANRFLRGMVRALVATMLGIAKSQSSIREFQVIIESRDCTKASFAVPPHGLFLVDVSFNESISK